MRYAISQHGQPKPGIQMNTRQFKPKAYVLDGCPFSFKFWLFMVEAGIADEIEVIRCDPDDPGFGNIKARLAQGLGRAATFPTAEIGPGEYLADSDALIERFATRKGVDPDRLPALTFYLETIVPQVVELHRLEAAP